jgi:hypothetical protein
MKRVHSLAVVVVASLFAIALTKTSSCSDNKCAGFCEVMLGYCLTIACVHNPAIEDCYREHAGCYQESCLCQPPYNTPQDNCYTNCRSGVPVNRAETPPLYEKYWRSIKMFHGYGGNLDTCKFYPQHNCRKNYYTGCKGSCNLKNIQGELVSVVCHWDPVGYPS